MAGYYLDGSRAYGFVYSNGTFTTLDPPGATYSIAWSINNRGQVAGNYNDGSRSYGFVYSNGTFAILEAPGAIDTSALSINDSGQVVGSYLDSSSHSFVYSNGCAASAL